MKVLIAGSAGFVGERVTKDLFTAGHNITAIASNEKSRARLATESPNISIVVANLTSAIATKGIVPEGTEAIIYLPGLLREFTSKGITFQGVHVDGVRNLLSEAKLVGARRWIQMSALGAGPTSKTGYYKTKWQAEELVRSSGLDWTIIRPSVIFDTKPNPKMNFVGELGNVVAHAPFLPVFGDGKYRMQPIALSEVSEVIVRSLVMPETIQKSYDLGGPEKLEYKTILRMIAGAMGKKRVALLIPFPLVELPAKLLGGFKFFPISEDQLAMLKEENIVKESVAEEELRKTFGLPRIRLEEGLKGYFG